LEFKPLERLLLLEPFGHEKTSPQSKILSIGQQSYWTFILVPTASNKEASSGRIIEAEGIAEHES
jgi:hypothetical protein